MQLLRSPWEKAFADFGQMIHSKAVLVSPYIGSAPLLHLRSVLNREEPPKIDLITNFELDSLLQGTVAVEAIADFSRELPSVTVRHLPGLHAKVYVADESLAIITSGNLTQASLRVNHEFGVQFTEPAIVRQIAAEMSEYGSQGTQLSIDQLDELAEKVQPLRAKYREVMYKSSQQDNQELRKVLEAAREVLTDMTGESETAVFYRTIREILKGGPLSTKEMHPIIQGLHPDFCDDSAYQISNGVSYGRLWKHAVRTAQKHLKRRGDIVNMEGKWHLVR